MTLLWFLWQLCTSLYREAKRQASQSCRGLSRCLSCSLSSPPFLASSSSPLQLPAQLERLELVARGCSEQVTNMAENLPVCRQQLARLRQGSSCTSIWGDLPVNAYIEAFLNNVFHHLFKGKTASEVMQWLSDETFTVKKNSIF